MNKYLKTTLSTGLFAGLALAGVSQVHAQNVFSSGLVQDAANWSGGLPTTVGNVGIIGAGDVGEIGNTSTTGTQVSVNGLFIDQQGGNITSTGFQGSEFINTTWTVNGGTLGTTQQQDWDSSTLTLNSGGAIQTAGGRDFALKNGTSFTMNGGSLTSGDEFRLLGNSTFTMDGGTVSTNGNFGSGFAPSGTMNINAGTVTAGGNIGGKNANYTINVGSLGVVSISADGLQGNRNSIIFDWDSTASLSSSLTITGADKAFYEDLYNNTGELLVDGSAASPFDNNFQVSGETLSLVPEPSTYALIFGALALGIGILRRRRKA